MEDAGGRRGRLAVGVDVGHDVMAHLPLPRGGHLVVDVGDVGLHLLHLPGGDGQAQLMLRSGQRHP